jgi:xanthine dehydrogenase accessory factor
VPRFFAQLRDHLAKGPVALATVVAAEGSTPRVAGARQFLAEDGTMAGTVGGGLTESRVLASARETLGDGRFRSLEGDLFGEPHDVRDGVCGGRMLVWLTRLEGVEILRVVEEIERSLRLGKRVILRTQATSSPALEILRQPIATGLHGTVFAESIDPPPHVLIIGAGHVGRALARQMTQLGFVASVQNDRRELLTPGCFDNGDELEPDLAACAQKLRSWEGPRYVALVTRGFRQDVDALSRLADQSGLGWLDYLGVLGSKRRIATVLTACRQTGLQIPREILRAPIGVPIGAETPEEIAVSIGAEMVRDLRGKNGARAS